MNVTGDEEDGASKELLHAETDPDAATKHTVGDNADAPDADERDYVGSVFAAEVSGESAVAAATTLRTTFAPWHHPVKQFVREYQWADLVRKLVDEHRTEDQRDTLKYFTLPGADLLD